MVEGERGAPLLTPLGPSILVVPYNLILLAVYGYGWNTRFHTGFHPLVDVLVLLALVRVRRTHLMSHRNHGNHRKAARWDRGTQKSQSLINDFVDKGKHCILSFISYLFIPNLSFRMRLTLWLMRSSLSVPLFTAAITASKASMK